MRSLLPFPSRALRRGLGVLLVAAIGGTTGCSWITGIPDVKSVDVGLDNPTIAAGGNAVASCTIYGKDQSIVHSTKVLCGFASSNLGVATVNSTTGQVSGVAPGTALITATARGHSDTITVTVTDAPPARIDLTVPSLYLQEGCQTLDIKLFDRNGQVLAPRAASVNVSNPSVATYTNAGTTAGVKLCAVTQGTTTVTVTVSGVQTLANVIVSPARVGKAQASLQKGTNTILETEVQQAVVVLFAGDGVTQIPNAGQQFTFLSDDPTVASVGVNTGIVTGVRTGQTTIRVTIGGSPVQTSFVVTVNPIPAKEVRIGNRGPFIRLGSNGTGVQSVRQATVLDSLGRTINGRVVTYKSTDPSVFTVTTVGTVTGLKLGTALLVASADNGAVADTISLQVTPVPIASITVTPTQTTINQGGTQQLTATLTDSLGVVVTGRPITWQSSNPTAIPVDANGLVTGIGSGSASIQAVAFVVPGLPGQIGSNPLAAVIVLPTPIATIDVTPTTVTVKAGSSTIVQIVPRDAKGTQIFNRNASINVQSDNPSIALADNQGNVRGLQTGTAHITYQALDSNGNPQGAATIVTVTVN